MTPQPFPDDLARRLEHLERRSRRAGTLALSLLFLLAGLAMRSQPVLRGERIELISASGATQAVLLADTAGVYLTLLDTRGRPAGAIRLNAEPWLSVRTGEGREVAGLGSPKVHQLRD
jgi:hypothetical protein